MSSTRIIPQDELDRAKSAVLYSDVCDIPPDERHTIYEALDDYAVLVEQVAELRAALTPEIQRVDMGDTYLWPVKPF